MEDEKNCEVQDVELKRAMEWIYATQVYIKPQEQILWET